MPFTVSHTIVAVPLRRLLAGSAVTSALVIGTIVPDYRHFMPGLYHLPTHSPAALLWFALPVGVATYVLFETLLRAPVLALLPLAVRRRLGPFLGPTASPRPPLSLVALSVIVGAASHLLWDAFTHQESFIVEAFPAFFYKIYWERGTYHLFTFVILQHASSLVGMVLLVVWCRRWLARQPVDETIGPGATAAERALALVVVVVAPALALVARFGLSLHGGLPVRRAAALGVAAAGIVLAVGVFACAIAWRRTHRVPSSADADAGMMPPSP